MISRSSLGESFDNESGENSVRQREFVKKEIYRLERLESAMQDEGPAVWQMQESDKNQETLNNLVDSRVSYHLRDLKEEKQANQIRLRLRSIERKDAAIAKVHVWRIIQES